MSSRRISRAFWIGLCALVLSPLTLAAQSGVALDVAAVRDAADQKDWVGARQAAGRAAEPVVRDLYEWRLLSAGEGDWRTYRDFVARAGDWPNLKRIRAKGEAVMPPGLALGEIDAFLGADGPQTGSGALRRADALRAAGRDGEADEEIARAWRELSLTVEEQNAFRARHGRQIAPHHQARFATWSRAWRGGAVLLPCRRAARQGDGRGLPRARGKAGSG